MLVRVMHVRAVRMHMHLGLVPMEMSMRPDRRRVVIMVVMAVVVRVGVVVLERIMAVLVPVALREVQEQPGDEQHGGDPGGDAGRSVPERERA